MWRVWQVPRLLLHCALARKYIRGYITSDIFVGCTFSYARNHLCICCENSFAYIHSYPKCLLKVNIYNMFCSLASEDVNEFMKQRKNCCAYDFITWQEVTVDLAVSTIGHIMIALFYQISTKWNSFTISAAKGSVRGNLHKLKICFWICEWKSHSFIYSFKNFSSFYQTEFFFYSFIFSTLSLNSFNRETQKNS